MYETKTNQNIYLMVEKRHKERKKEARSNKETERTKNERNKEKETFTPVARKDAEHCPRKDEK